MVSLSICYIYDTFLMHLWYIHDTYMMHSFEAWTKTSLIHSYSETVIKYNDFTIREAPLVAIFTRNMSSNFFPLSSLSIYEYNSWKKTACYRPFKNGHFVRVCKEKMMDHQAKWETYIKTVIRWELTLNTLQINQKIISYRPFHRVIDETLKILEKCLPLLYLNFTRVLQFSSRSASPRL